MAEFKNEVIEIKEALKLYGNKDPAMEAVPNFERELRDQDIVL